MIPGTSRSGATILGAMLIGCSRPAAAEFSFFLGIPVMFGASFLKIVKFFIQGGGFSFAEFIYLVLGMVVAFGVSVYSIKFLMGYVRKHDFKFFGYYRIVLGIVVLSYFGISALNRKRGFRPDRNAEVWILFCVHIIHGSGNANIKGMPCHSSGLTRLKW